MVQNLVLLGLLVSSAQAQTTASPADLECTQKLEAIVTLTKLFAENPINGGVYVEARVKESNLDQLLTFAADALVAYKGKVCEASGRNSRVTFLLSANAACSHLASMLWAYEFQSEKIQKSFNAALTQLAGPASTGNSWDDCPGFSPEELKKPRIKRP